MKKRILKSRRRFVLSLLLLLAVVAGVYAAGVYQICRFNSHLDVPETGRNLLARFALDEQGNLYSPSGKVVTLDMGSRHTFINRKTLDEFKREGYPAFEVPTLIFTTDQNGHYRLYTRKVTMPMLLTDPNAPDSILHLGNAELLIATDDHPNVIGMDTLEHFVVGRDADTGEISFYRNVPEGYSLVSELNGGDMTVAEMIGYNRRLYIPLQVNDDNAQNYYFDTGKTIRGLDLVQPLGNIERAKSPVVSDSASGLMVQPKCRVIVGQRVRFADVAYSDTLHTDKYSLNPFRLFTQSFVIDVPGKKLYYKQ